MHYVILLVLVLLIAISACGLNRQKQRKSTNSKNKKASTNVLFCFTYFSPTIFHSVVCIVLNPIMVPFLICILLSRDFWLGVTAAYRFVLLLSLKFSCLGKYV